MRILVCDDEKLIRDLIKEYVENEGYKCDEASDGNMAIAMVEENDYDLIVMDIMMPGMDGITAVREIKQIKDIPVLMLSARKEEEDKLQGFDSGIDDYVTKPFSPKELIARIKVILKRNGNDDLIVCGNISIDNVSHDVKIDGNSVDLTSTQYDLLSLFITNKDVALSREKIIEKVFGYDYEADDRTIDAHIKLLRSKLGKYRNSIKTIRNVGYKFIYEEE
ncbi:MAG: response regulator transcription factor [Bacilli bacterium]|nr:response regulator transcription factor [Bacilli bacterium]